MKEEIVGKNQAQVSIVSFGGGVYSVTISRKGEIRKRKACSWEQVEEILREVQPAKKPQQVSAQAILGNQALNTYAGLAALSLEERVRTLERKVGYGAQLNYPGAQIAQQNRC